MTKHVIWSIALAGLLATGSCTFDEQIGSLHGPLSTSFYLDSYGPVNNGASGPEYSAEALEPGRLYRVTVRGTFSVWSSVQSWCGAPEAAPMYPSPGRQNRGVALDAEFMFAAPSGSAHCSSLPRRSSAFELSVDGGLSWAHVAADTEDQENHEYSYLVSGQGFPLGARIRDTPITDNYGMLKLTIEPVSVDEDGDGVPDDRDLCPNTASSDMAAGVPSVELGVNRWADIDGDGVFDTVSPRGKGPELSFTIEDTAGCSCAQIIERLELGQGHIKFGCSISAMRDWVSLVSQRQ